MFRRLSLTLRKLRKVVISNLAESNTAVTRDGSGGGDSEVFLSPEEALETLREFFRYVSDRGGEAVFALEDAA